MSYEQEPVVEVLNGAQKIVYDETFVETKINEALVTYTGHNAEYNQYTISEDLVAHVNMNSMVLSVPVEIKFYSNNDAANLVNPLTLQWGQYLWADVAMMSIFWTIIVKLNNQQIDKEDSSKMRNLKQIMADYKYDDSEYEALGKWGLFFTQTFTPDNQVRTGPAQQYGNPFNYAWLQNPQAQRDSFLQFLQSIAINYQVNSLTGVNLAGTPTGYPVMTGVQMRSLSMTVNLALPLKWFHAGFRSNGRLPPGMNVRIEMQAFRAEQLVGVFPLGLPIETETANQVPWSFVTVRLNADANKPKLYYAYDYLNPAIDSIVNRYRMTNDLTYTNDLREEFVLQGSNGPNFNRAITTQQQLPTEIIIRKLAVATNKGSQGDVYVPFQVSAGAANNNGIGQMLVLNAAYFYDSLCHAVAADNTNHSVYLREIRIKNSGKDIYAYVPNDNLAFGNFNPAPQDYIFLDYMNKNSFLNLTVQSTGTQRASYANLSSKIVNGNNSFIFMPGGQVQQGEQYGNTKAYNVDLSIIYSGGIESAKVYLSVLRKIPSMLTISALNEVRELMWPQMEKDGFIKVVQPVLSN
jgi:hypothetical protein